MAAICAGVSLTAMAFAAGSASAECWSCADPAATTTSASGVTYYSAYLNGQVDPNGCATEYFFEIRKSGGGWKALGKHNVLSEESPESVQEWEPFLEPSTKYEYRLNAVNSEGDTDQGTIVPFTTLSKPNPHPAATTEAATEITSNGATLNGFVNPNGSSTTYKFEYGTTKGFLTKSTSSVSIGTTSQKVKAEVSLEPGTTYYFRVSATNSGGTTTGSELSFTTAAGLWKIKETLNPGASDNYLYDVSCETSTSACTGVGKSVSSGVDSPMALRWNGTAWSEQAPAKKSGATHTRLLGIDCPSETRCLAVGNHQSAGGPSLLSEIWNEGKWTVQTTPLPSESTSSEFVAIGCNSTANCTAVGSATIGGVKKAIAERWTSPNWALSSIPIPEGAESSQLDGVDCLWSNFCVAVGRFTSSKVVESFVLFWDGTEWSQQNVTAPVGAVETFLTDVSCTPTPNRCMAVGGWKNSSSERFTLAYRFNGVSTWTLQSTPNPSGGKQSVFEDVSCATETSCTAVGNWVGSGSTKTLATAWNGTSWSLQSPPNPAGASFSSLLGVSCRSTSCMSVGWSSNGAGTDTTLSEFRE
ncbi:MAG TPA: fibronectin type III domain-containing protein [Solirubrobacterales bacterium]